MAANGSNSSCPDLDWYSGVGRTASLVVYCVISPCYILLGLLFHGVSLKAFYHQTKQEKAYLYQVSTTISETIEVIARLVYVAGFEWFTDVLLNFGPNWYRSCYVCMWFSAKMGTFFINTMITTSLLLSVCMSADRLYALWKPFSYKTVNIKRNHAIAVCVCTFLGIFTSTHQLCQFIVKSAPTDKSTGYQMYQIAFAPFYATYVNAVSQTRNALQGVALAILYFCSFRLVWLFHARTSTAAKKLRRQEKARKDIEKTLTFLTICQCVCMTLATTYHIIHTIILLVYPTFHSCSGLLFIPLHDVFLQIIDLADFVFAIAVSKQFRIMILQQLRCGKENIVGTLVQSGAQNTSQL